MGGERSQLKEMSFMEIWGKEGGEKVGGRCQGVSREKKRKEVGGNTYKLRGTEKQQSERGKRDR